MVGPMHDTSKNIKANGRLHNLSQNCGKGCLASRIALYKRGADEHLASQHPGAPALNHPDEQNSNLSLHHSSQQVANINKHSCQINQPTVNYGQ